MVNNDCANSTCGAAAALIEPLAALRAEMRQMVEEHAAGWEGAEPAQVASMHNLLHYLALRRHDRRDLQERLAALGLSSLGRSEAHVLATITSVLQVLHRLADREWPADPPAAVDFAAGSAILARRTQQLLGPVPAGRRVRIMVTMPSEAAADYTLVHGLVERGMDCMRVNCAHDGPAEWERMIAHLRRAAEATGRPCRVLMDLAGPKLRTGPVAPEPAVVKLRPQRDRFGCVTAPARVWLHAANRPSAPPTAADAVLPVPADWLAGVQVGDEIRFRDARHAPRSLQVLDVGARGCWAESVRTAYIVPGTPLRLRRDGKAGARAAVGALPGQEQGLLLGDGDTLLLTRAPLPGRPAVRDSAGRVLTSARISCTLPSVFADVKPGERVWLDDGKIGGVVRAVDDDNIQVQITDAGPDGSKLRADKGINLPDSALQVPALTEKDVADLDFVATHADLVGYSFVHTPEDIEELQARLTERGSRQVGIILKIETARAFERLPSLLLAVMRWPAAGVMIARGDLAVECGFERLAEIQEEILWICEAAHLPVIWATQVLEHLAKEGKPSRAEITDAALSQRAECVMLNKGPHIGRALTVLDDILRRMERHQSKKSAMLRGLNLARVFQANGQ